MSNKTCLGNYTNVKFLSEMEYADEKSNCLHTFSWLFKTAAAMAIFKRFSPKLLRALN